MDGSLTSSESKGSLAKRKQQPGVSISMMLQVCVSTYLSAAARALVSNNLDNRDYLHRGFFLKYSLIIVSC